jgi:hypothetical protein
MAPSEIRGPDLAGVVADANAVGLEHIVIGGFAVIAHGYFRATKDSDLLVPTVRRPTPRSSASSSEPRQPVSVTARFWPLRTWPARST